MNSVRIGNLKHGGMFLIFLFSSLAWSIVEINKQKELGQVLFFKLFLKTLEIGTWKVSTKQRPTQRQFKSDYTTS
jgi:hypothetical protein